MTADFDQVSLVARVKSMLRVKELHDKVAQRPRVAAYLASERRLPFNEMGIFRQLRALDG